MIVIIHRINTLRALEQVPDRYGVEIDVRGHQGELLLSHDPILDPARHDRLEDYLRAFHHAFVVFNMKDTGHEQQTIELASRYGIDNFFLLDVSAPYLYSAARIHPFRKVAIRYSEIEPIEAVGLQLRDGHPLLDWVWIDTFTSLPLDERVIETLRHFRSCLVCPERWGRPQDIPVYRAEMRRLGFELDAVMTAAPCAEQWETAQASHS